MCKKMSSANLSDLTSPNSTCNSGFTERIFLIAVLIKINANYFITLYLKMPDDLADIVHFKQYAYYLKLWCFMPL